MPELSLIQWAGVAALACYAAWRGWPTVKAKLPTLGKKEQPWTRERVMFQHLCELVEYCQSRGETKAVNSLRDVVLPLLLTPDEEVKSDETQ